MPERKPLLQISSVAWEHPADRAALNTLRAIPGFDGVVRQVASFFGERGVRQLFLANAVRVGPTQRPKLHELFTEVLETLDWPTRPQLYVTQTPFVNAGAVGFQEPFIVINSGLIEVLDREEQRFILAHELGHIMSGHVTYRTIALILIWVGQNLSLLELPLLPFRLALLEWYRKAELSADRAGLLGVQDVFTAQRTFLKMAGGAPSPDDPIDLDAFMAQASEYESEGGAWDKVFKIINTAFRDHPFNTVRASELQRWVYAGEYERILAGSYPRRGTTDQPPLSQDYQEAADYYGSKARGAMDELNGVFNRAKDAFNSTFRGSSEP